MLDELSLDTQVRLRLRTWPQRPPGVPQRSFGRSEERRVGKECRL